MLCQMALQAPWAIVLIEHLAWLQVAWAFAPV